MLYLLLALVALGVLTALFTLLTHRKGDDDTVVQPKASDCATCDGLNARCEQDCMLEAATKEVEYYDDEELDSFRHRASDSYTDAEVEAFSEVLYTLKPNEVKAWGRSLILREIQLPDQLKDEFIALGSEEGQGQ